MSRELTPELWYELDHIRSAWSEFHSMGASQLENERMARLDDLVSMGLVECWEPTYGGRRFYRITDKGLGTLDKRNAKGLRTSPEPQVPPSESYTVMEVALSVSSVVIDAVPASSPVSAEFMVTPPPPRPVTPVANPVFVLTVIPRLVTTAVPPTEGVNESWATKV